MRTHLVLDDGRDLIFIRHLDLYVHDRRRSGLHDWRRRGLQQLEDPNQRHDQNLEEIYLARAGAQVVREISKYGRLCFDLVRDSGWAGLLLLRAQEDREELCEIGGGDALGA